MKRFVIVLAAIAAVLAAPNAATAATAACRLDFSAWPGGFTANGTLTGQLALTAATGTTVTSSWNGEVTAAGTQLTLAANGSFGFTGTTNGAFVLPAGIPPACTVTINGSPAPAVLAEPAAAGVREGTSATLTVRLSAPPAATVPIAMRMSGGGVWAMPPVLLTFSATDWDKPKSLSLYAMKDADTENNVMVVTLTALGYVSDTVTLTQLDAGWNGTSRSR